MANPSRVAQQATQPTKLRLTVSPLTSDLLFRAHVDRQTTNTSAKVVRLRVLDCTAEAGSTSCRALVVDELIALACVEKTLRKNNPHKQHELVSAAVTASPNKPDLSKGILQIKTASHQLRRPGKTNPRARFQDPHQFAWSLRLLPSPFEVQVVRSPRSAPSCARHVAWPSRTAGVRFGSGRPYTRGGISTIVLPCAEMCAAVRLTSDHATTLQVSQHKSLTQGQPAPFSSAEMRFAHILRTSQSSATPVLLAAQLSHG